MVTPTKARLYSDPEKKPTILLPDLGAVPTELQAAPRWVLWRLVWKTSRKGGKWDKPPFRADGRAAKSNDPRTWVTFEEAASAYRAGRFDGVGFMLGDGFAGIDLDDVRDLDTGVLTPAAAELVERFATHAEVSPSGTGVKLIGRGEWCADWHRKPFTGGGEIEGYSAGRYFTVTGQSVGTHPVADIQCAMDELAARLAGGRRGASARVSFPGLSDDALIRRALGAKNGVKFRRLWAGDASDYDGDESRADLALCGMLAFWCGGDGSQIDRLFRRSALLRSKWNERRGERTYGQLTIARALEGQTEFYTSGRASATKLTTWPGANGKPPPEDSPLPTSPQTGAAIILAYFRERYQPLFRRRNAVVTRDGEEVPMGVACAVPDSGLIDRLAGASDAPSYKGGAVNRGALPKFFVTWAKVAWGDLLKELPDEDAAELGTDSPAREEFRRLVREALLTEVVLGDTIGDSNVTQTERRSLIDWCERFAKPGPWRSIRSKMCWCKVRQLPDGEIRLAVAIRHELFSQLRADRRLSEMGANTFARRAACYGVGQSTREDRPHGRSAIVLSEDFIADLVSGIASDEEDEVPEG